MDDLAFWMVWNPQRHALTYRHEQKRDAVMEAEKLARMNPGEQFFVLEATELRMVDDMKRVTLELPIPF